jgi:hypothetical protein
MNEAVRDNAFGIGPEASQNSTRYCRPRTIAAVARSFRQRNEVAVLVEKTTFEKHYRVGELAELWGLGRETVRKLIMNEPGVIKIRLGRRKAHTMYSVPESVAERVHTRLLNAA